MHEAFPRRVGRVHAVGPASGRGTLLPHRPPGARPYYLCPALTHDLLSPARALITIRTWTLVQRIIGPLSPRVDFLTGAVRIAEAVRAAAETANTGPSPVALRLL